MREVRLGSGRRLAALAMSGMLLIAGGAAAAGIVEDASRGAEQAAGDNVRDWNLQTGAGMDGMSPTFDIGFARDDTGAASADASSQGAASSAATEAVEAATTPQIDVFTPPVAAPAACELGRCGSSLAHQAPVTVTTPDVPAVEAAVPSESVPQVCGYLACVGPFSTAGKHLATTPQIESTSAATPDVDAGLPGWVDRGPLADGLYVASETVTVPSLDADLSSLSVTTNAPAPKTIGASSVQYRRLGPISVSVPVEGWTEIPVTLCPSGCTLPLPSVSGSIFDVTVQFGGLSQTVSVEVPQLG